MCQIFNSTKRRVDMKIYNDNGCSSCYFRTVADPPNKKCLLQLTEKCNLHCQHCFVSSTSCGNEIDFRIIEKIIIPHLIKNNISKVTLTGGEPFVYSNIIEVINLLSQYNMEVSVCTNASVIKPKHLTAIKKINKIHFNVSLDGFSIRSHGRFRGFQDDKLFDSILNNIKLIGDLGLLNGILVTPNIYASIDEYKQIYDYGKECGATYVLFNPLSQFGRGEKSIDLAYSNNKMIELRNELLKYSDGKVELVFIRFPNTDNKPLGKCHAGEIFYIFTNGEVTFCPYMVFAAKDKISQYDYKEFIIGNVFDESFDFNDCDRLAAFQNMFNMYCENCSINDCGKGCFASKISQGNKLMDHDQLCPIMNRKEI